MSAPSDVEAGGTRLHPFALTRVYRREDGKLRLDNVRHGGGSILACSCQPAPAGCLHGLSADRGTSRP